MAKAVRVGSGPADDTHCLVLATDGLSEIGIGVANPAAAVVEAVATAQGGASELRPVTAARAVVERALAAQQAQRAGDNVASAVLWVAEPG